MGTFTALEVLDLARNLLTGSIPSEWTDGGANSMWQNTLYRVDLSSNLVSRMSRWMMILARGLRARREHRTSRLPRVCLRARVGAQLTGTLAASWATAFPAGAKISCVDLASNMGLCGQAPGGMPCVAINGTRLGACGGAPCDRKAAARQQGVAVLCAAANVVRARRVGLARMQGTAVTTTGAWPSRASH